MISSGYVVDLYCDCADCAADSHSMQEYHPKCGFAQYSGETWAECKRGAKQDGWYISNDRQTCFAPGHKRKKQ